VSFNRRDFLKVSAASAVSAAVSCIPKYPDLNPSIQKLKPMTDGIIPILKEDRLARIEEARQLMRKNQIAAMYIEAGTSLFYFTGVKWWQSERMFAVVIPQKGEIAYVCPKFEEDRAYEQIQIGDDIRTWEEDESPYKRVVQILNDRGIRTGHIGIEEQTRFFLFDGIRKEAPQLTYVSADPVAMECRLIKSPKEISLMQRASDITIEAYKATLKTLRAGMTKEEFSANSKAAHRALGVEGGIWANFGESTAFPHGSIKKRKLREGDIVLMDGGCSVDGYKSDISRTIVFGEPTQRQQEMWDLAQRAKAASFAKAGVGVPCEDVDAAARQVYINVGFGPDYKVPGCPHRTGHGIGLDGHECIHLVRGNKRPMEVGMCFSNEPMIVLPEEFGIRLEDCFYITEEGSKYFTGPSPAIDQPFA